MPWQPGIVEQLITESLRRPLKIAVTEAPGFDGRAQFDATKAGKREEFDREMRLISNGRAAA